MFSVEDGRIEFVASEEPNHDDSLAMGVYFKRVDLDTVFGRMLDRKMTRRSWITGVDTGKYAHRPFSHTVMCKVFLTTKKTVFSKIIEF